MIRNVFLYPAVVPVNPDPQLPVSQGSYQDSSFPFLADLPVPEEFLG